MTIHIWHCRKTLLKLHLFSGLPAPVEIFIGENNSSIYFGTPCRILNLCCCKLWLWLQLHLLLCTPPQTTDLKETFVTSQLDLPGRACRPRQLIFFLAPSYNVIVRSNLFLDCSFEYRISANSFRPWIVSAPVCTQYCDQRSQYIRLNSKKNSFHGNYSRKYGTLEIKTFSLGSRTQDVCS